ncbi:nucleotidyltransferase family protein [Guptibacillus algicola]|uniref:nucleotidyltransferase family protein n=1 Tax=Guptibacillus algicola TaxID=225844 RepID=UPI001CD813E6|nr:nucleotidyltransferase family protein [Alkalihalobacillus algicola]MCA0987200.1 nucleotidyltransferase family protein [Alkalihalobacillus algicola]
MTVRGVNEDIQSQIERLEEIIHKNDSIQKVLNVAHAEFDHYYIGAGSIVQTVWNDLSGNPLNYGINDIDIIYYDEDLSGEKEKKIEQRLQHLLCDLPLEIDVKNEARVHLWYEEKFGRKIEQYQSLEDAINSWPTTATALGVRKDDEGTFKVYAPYGLNDLFTMTVRANKVMITRDVYEAKVVKWTSKWDLNVIPWKDS